MVDDASATTPSPGSRGRWDFRFSTASSSTTATVSTLPPQYSPVADDDWGFDSPSQTGLGVGSDTDSVSPQISFSSSSLSPPRYSAIHPITLDPPAEAGMQSSHFQYMYSVKSTKPWARLLLYSREAVPGDPRPLQGQPKVPRIWGSEPITGRIELDLDNPLVIQQINIVVKGKITASALDEGSHKFLDYEFNLWDASDGGPGSYDNNKSKFNGKLTGNHAFPFHFRFPNEIDPSLEATSPSDDPAFLPPSLPSLTRSDLSSKREGQRNSLFPFSSPLVLSERLGRRLSGTQRSKKQLTPSPLDPQVVQDVGHPPLSRVASSMPQTFIEKAISATVKYQLSVHFVHGRFKPDSRITTDIWYIPASQPHPSSLKRRQAYECGALIPGPMSDPEGWFDLPTASVDGIFKSVLGSRQSKVDCKFYLAQPLSYTRGTVIPCYLTLSSNDSEALASLSRPDIPNVKLVRHLRHFAVADNEKHVTPSVIYLSPTVPTPQRPDTSLLRKTVHHEVATATWWDPPKDVRQDSHIRHLEGEIHLHPDLQPSCSSEVFHVEYFVQMFSLKSAKFEQTQQPPHSSSHGEKAARVGPTTVIASLPVDITTLCRLDEPLPITFTEPSKTTMRQVLRDSSPETTMSRLLVSSAFL